MTNSSRHLDSSVLKLAAQRISIRKGTMHQLARKTTREVMDQSDSRATDYSRRVGADDQTRCRIAILSERNETLDRLWSIITELGCTPEIISDHEFERVEAELWDLVIIASAGNPASLILRGAVASRNQRTRVMVVAPDRNPQYIADVLLAGADDYVSVPFDPDECRVRIQSLIAGSTSMTERRNHDLVFDFSARIIGSGTMVITLSMLEWNVLIALLEIEHQPVSAGELAILIWGDSRQEAMVSSTISRIRRRFRSQGFSIINVKTVRGKGYTAEFRRTSDSLIDSRKQL